PVSVFNYLHCLLRGYHIIFIVVLLINFDDERIVYHDFIFKTGFLEQIILVFTFLIVFNSIVFKFHVEYSK
ncbi:MAG: hypothetical protein ACLSXC_07600, partial [Beduini sp.]